MFKLYGQILDSDMEQTVTLKRVYDTSNSCSLCSATDSYLAKIQNFPRMAVLHSHVHINLGELFDDCDEENSELPEGMCMDYTLALTDEGEYSPADIQEYAEQITKKGLVPMKTGDDEHDKQLAVVIVTLNSHRIEQSVKMLNDLIQEWPDYRGALYCRAVAILRNNTRSYMNAGRLKDALDDITKVINHKSDSVLAYARRAQIHMLLGNHSQALADITVALNTRPTHMLQFLRGLIHLTIENYQQAELDFRQVMIESSRWYIDAYLHLGLCLYYRGKLRNAIEVFKGVLRQEPEHLVASLSLSQAFSELGNLVAARSRFNQTLSLNRTHAQTLQLHGDMFYHSGNINQALVNFRKCVARERSNPYCQYMVALCRASRGHLYGAVKSTTKVLVQRPNYARHAKVPPEYLKALYLREQSRYLHNHLDLPVDSINMDRDFAGPVKDAWVKMIHPPSDYTEQLSIQPGIVMTPPPSSSLPLQSRALVCHALRVGESMQTNSDGYIPNQRLNLLMGLAALHISQHLEARWQSFKQNKPPDRALTWPNVFHIAVSYRQLVNPEQPVFWVDRLPDHSTSSGHRADITFIRGYVVNVKVRQYFPLVFKVLRTMLEHYSSEEDADFSSLDDEADETKLCSNLLDIMKKQNLNQNAFLVSTQVPSSIDPEVRLEGVMVTLSQDEQKRVLFYINVGSTVQRTERYHTELRHTFSQIQDEMKKAASSKIGLLNMDAAVKHVLTLVYYFYNLMPLTHGTSVVAYTVALGLLMSFDTESTGKLPPGKLLEFEAILAGSPETFVLITKQWMVIRKMQSSVHSLPKVWDAFPTVRSLLDLLSTIPIIC